MTDDERSGGIDSDPSAPEEADQPVNPVGGDDVDAMPDAASDAPESAPDSDEHGRSVDEFAATREVVADPDDWRLESRETVELAQAGPTQLTPEEEETAKRYRILTHAAAGTSAFFLLLTLVTHFMRLGHRGVPTWLVTLAGLAALGAIYAFPRARFSYREVVGEPLDLARRRHIRTLTLRAFGISFGLAFVLLVFLDLMAFMVATKLMPDLSQSGLTLARNFVLIPVVAIGLAVGAVYTRTRIPSHADPWPFERKLSWVMLGAFGVASLVAAFFALGLPSVVRVTEIEARQAIYVQGVAAAVTVALANMHLRIPDAVRIIMQEVEQAKQVDRAKAQDLQKRMLRNYFLALIFVVGSIGFLVGKAAGLVTTGGSAGLDIALIIYVGFGVIFLAMVVTNYYQSKSMKGRVVIGKKGQSGPGKRRFRPDEITRYTILGVSGFFTLVFLVMMLLVGFDRVDNLFGIPVSPRAGTDLFVFAALSAIGPYGFYHMRETNRIRGIDEKFPDFLRDLAESQRAGMTLPRALITSSKGVYGPLTPEIKIMAAQVEWGVSFDEALRRFAERTRTPLIERTCSLVREAAASGGNVVDVLSAASDDAREIKNIMFERKAQMSVYSLIVYIAFGVFLTVIGVLNSQFIPELAGATSQVAGSSLGGIQFGNIDVPAYQQLFFHAALIQGMGGGLVSGVMTEGHPLSGLRHSFIMTLMAYLAFRLLII